MSTPDNSLTVWLAGARPRTLPAAVVPVAVGAASVWGEGIVWWRVAAALLVSLLLQVGVNYANDYSDGVSGTDDGRVGPLRLVAAGIRPAAQVKRAAMVSFGLAGVVGLALAAATSWWLLLIGAASILAAWGYTGGPRPYGYLGLGEVFVFVFFGVVATVGTAYVAAEKVPSSAWLVSLGVGSLACALLVINNLRDIPTDRPAGKRTLAVRLGDQRTRWLFGGLIAAAFVAAVSVAPQRPWALVVLAATPAAVAPLRVVASGATGGALIAALSSTGRLQLAYGALLSIGLALSAASV